MEAALGLHALAARSTWGFAHGRFLVPLGGLDSLVTERRHLDHVDALEVGVVVGSPADPNAPAPLGEVVDAVERTTGADSAISIAVVEFRPSDQTVVGVDRAAADLAGVAAALGADGFVEVVVTGDDASGISSRLEALAGSGVGAKVRCGGLAAGMVPAPEALAEFIGACVRDEVPFKATAGLHHALSASSPEARFGYLNLLVATVLAQRGADDAEIASALATEGPVAVEAELHLGGHRASRVDVAAARSAFMAFGTCSFTEPLADLKAIPGMTEVA